MDVVTEGGVCLLNPNLSLWVQQYNHLDFAFRSNMVASNSCRVSLITCSSIESGDVRGNTNDLLLVLQDRPETATCVTQKHAIFQQIQPDQTNLESNGNLEYVSIFRVELTRLVSDASTYFARMDNISTPDVLLSQLWGSIAFSGKVEGCMQESYNHRSLPIMVSVYGNVLSLTATIFLDPICVLEVFRFNGMETRDKTLKTVWAKEELEPQKLWIGKYAVQWEIHEWWRELPWIWLIPPIIGAVIGAIEKRIHLLSKMLKKHRKRRTRKEKPNPK
jgi:hypothetical protein